MCDTFTFSLWRKFGTYELAARLKHEGEHDRSTLELGGKVSFDKKTSLQGVLESSGNLSAVYSYKFNQNFTGSVGVTTNVTSGRGFNDVGFKLAYK